MLDVGELTDEFKKLKDEAEVLLTQAIKEGKSIVSILSFKLDVVWYNSLWEAVTEQNLKNKEENKSENKSRYGEFQNRIDELGTRFETLKAKESKSKPIFLPEVSL